MALALFFAVGFPILLARYFMKKDLFALIGIGLSVITVALLYSRTAYVTVVLSVFLYLLFTKRLVKYTPVLAVIIFIGSVVLSANIIDRATKGVEEQDLHRVSAGRVDKLWVPLLSEYSEEESSLLIGQGRYGMVNTTAHQSGMTLGATHPHKYVP